MLIKFLEKKIYIKNKDLRQLVGRKGSCSLEVVEGWRRTGNVCQMGLARSEAVCLLTRRGDKCKVGQNSWGRACRRGAGAHLCLQAKGVGKEFSPKEGASVGQSLPMLAKGAERRALLYSLMFAKEGRILLTLAEGGGTLQKRRLEFTDVGMQKGVGKGF